MDELQVIISPCMPMDFLVEFMIVEFGGKRLRGPEIDGYRFFWMRRNVVDGLAHGRENSEGI